MPKGFIEGSFLGDPAYDALNKTLERLAGAYWVTPDAIAYAWLLRYPARMQVITGSTSPDHLRSAAAAGDVVLSREEWYALYRAAGNRLP